MSEHKRRVLLTGATGYIAGQLLQALREHYELRLMDVRRENRDGAAIEGVEIADLLADDREQLKMFFDGIDTVVHCGYVSPAGSTSRAEEYDIQRRNVDMMHRVYDLALEMGVRRVVAASTNQAAKWYEQPYFAGLRDRVSPKWSAPEKFSNRVSQAACLELRSRRVQSSLRGRWT